MNNNFEAESLKTKIISLNSNGFSKKIWTAPVLIEIAKNSILMAKPSDVEESSVKRSS